MNKQNKVVLAVGLGAALALVVACFAFLHDRKLSAHQAPALAISTEKRQSDAPVEKIHVAAAVGFWVNLSGNAFEEVVQHEFGIVLDSNGKTYQDHNGQVIPFDGESWRKQLPGKALIVEGKYDAVWKETIRTNPNDSTVRVVTALCKEGVPVFTFADAMTPGGDATAYTDACQALVEEAPTSSMVTSAPPNPKSEGGFSSRNPGFRTYKNARFGFSIDYPQFFIAKRPPENGDGIELASTDGRAILVASGSNSSGLDLTTSFNTAVQSVKGELGYHTKGRNWFVVTWEDGDTLGYQKTFLGPASENSFTFTFPASQRADYDQVVTKVEKSFRAGDLGQTW
jgi:hypothetical protein